MRQARPGRGHEHPPDGRDGRDDEPLRPHAAEKQVVGTIFGSANIRYDIPKLLELYRQGQLDLDGMITNTYKLGDINQGYQDMRDGKNIRGSARLHLSPPRRPSDGT